MYILRRRDLQEIMHKGNPALLFLVLSHGFSLSVFCSSLFSCKWDADTTPHILLLLLHIKSDKLVKSEVAFIVKKWEKNATY